MKTNDQNISHKLDQLNTLGGGIVFGREEAWEKLQSRMDKKPARRIGLYYGVAAAVLLLFASLLFLFSRPEPQPQIAASHKSQQTPVSAPITPSTITEDPAPEPEVRHVQKTISKTIGYPSQTPLPQYVIAEAPKELPAPVAEQPAPLVNLASASPAPMRIVHINELDNDVTTVKPLEPAAIAVRLNPMKVVTMTEVMRNDYPAPYAEVKHRESAMPLVKVLFRQDQFTSPGNTISPQNPLNIRINLQN